MRKEKAIASAMTGRVYIRTLPAETEGSLLSNSSHIEAAGSMLAIDTGQSELTCHS